MKTMLFQTHQIKKPTPVAGDLGSGSRPLKGMRSGRGLKFGKQGQKAVRNRDGVGAAGSAFGLRKGHGASLKVNAGKGNPSFFHSAAGVVGNFKAGAHPVRDKAAGERFAASGNVILGKDWFAMDGAFAGSEIHHGHAGHVAKQSALPVDPLQNLNVLQRLVTADKPASGARVGGTPSNVFMGRCRAKIFDGDATVGHESNQVAPRVSVVDPSVGGDLVRFDKPLHPAQIISSLFMLMDGQLSGLLGSSSAMQSVVRSVPGGLGFPLAILGFIPDPIPLAVRPFVNRRHVASVANYPKTEAKK
jgi:hypothetical protein